MGYHFREQENFVRIVELTPALRRRIEATVEHLISLLDLYDGDDGHEDDGTTEPWLGWPERMAGRGEARSSRDDREIDDELDEDGGDDEPSLGWTAGGYVGATFADEYEEEGFHYV